MHSAIARSGDSILFQNLSTRRIHTNMTGMRLLGTWGLANTVAGIAGAVSAKDKQWQHFHQMNAAWGVVNSGIAGLGYIGARRELNKSLSNSEGLHRYEATKRLYLINAGLDGLYIGTGFFLTEHAKHTSDHTELYRGFGKSLIVQGAGLLLFDVGMFLSHQRTDKSWYRAIQGLTVTGDGIGWRYALR
jgi:hypothetical protein